MLLSVTCYQSVDLVLKVLMILLAIIGFAKWRDEVRAKTHFKFGTELLTSLVRLDQTIHRATMCLDVVRAFSSMPSNPNVSGDPEALRDSYRLMREAYYGFEARCEEAESLWGKRVLNLCEAILAHVRSIVEQMDRYVVMQLIQGRPVPRLDDEKVNLLVDDASYKQWCKVYQQRAGKLKDWLRDHVLDVGWAQRRERWRRAVSEVKDLVRTFVRRF